MPYIGHIFQHGLQHMPVPEKPFPLFVVVGEDPPVQPQLSGGGNSPVVELAKYRANSHAAGPHLEDLHHIGGGLRIRYKVVFVLGVFHIPIGSVASHKFSLAALLLQGRAGFPGDVLGIDVVDQIFQIDPQVLSGRLLLAVVLVVHSDKAHP